MELTASDRKNLVKLAAALPKGSKERRAILSNLKISSANWSKWKAIINKSGKEIEDVLASAQALTNNLREGRNAALAKELENVLRATVEERLDVKPVVKNLVVKPYLHSGGERQTRPERFVCNITFDVPSERPDKLDGRHMYEITDEELVQALRWVIFDGASLKNAKIKRSGKTVQMSLRDAWVIGAQG